MLAAKLLPPPNNRKHGKPERRCVSQALKRAHACETPLCSGFTLIELLVVIAIIAILSVVVILTLNPSQLLMQSRDANRVSDLANMNESLGIYAEDVGGSFGIASTTYISIPDPVATSTLGDQCQGLGLPSLPTSTAYHCAASSTYRSANGTGWIPVNFSSISIGSPLSVLPIDPINTTSSGDYYAYIPGQSSANTFELIERMESQKYTASTGAAANDGGYSNQYDEVGKDLTLALNMPQDLNRIPSTDYLSFDQSGLVGYWPLNEGAGTTAVDHSGNNNNGTWSGSQVGTSGYYSPGIVGNWAGAFTSSSPTLVNVGNPSQLQLTGNLTISAWINTSSNSGNNGIVTKSYNSAGSSRSYRIGINAAGIADFELSNSSGLFGDVFSNTAISLGVWQHVALSYNASVGSATWYINGVPAGTTTGLYTSIQNVSQNFQIGTWDTNTNANAFTGLIDDVRVYNRALSAQEIAAMYNGGM